MIPYSRPQLSDFYTLFESKLAENHTLHSGTYLYTCSSYMGVPHPPPPPRSLSAHLQQVVKKGWCFLFCIIYLSLGPRDIQVLYLTRIRKLIKVMTSLVGTGKIGLKSRISLELQNWYFRDILRAHSFGTIPE